MVEFEEIRDEHYASTVEPEENEGSDGDWSDDDSSDEDADDETSIATETFFDRIAALKDIIPPRQRDTIARTISKAYSYGTVATFIGGKVAYVLITSILMLGIPYALTLEEDRMIAEQERQYQMSQEMSGVLTLSRPCSVFVGFTDLCVCFRLWLLQLVERLLRLNNSRRDSPSDRLVSDFVTPDLTALHLDRILESFRVWNRRLPSVQNGNRRGTFPLTIYFVSFLHLIDYIA